MQHPDRDAGEHRRTHRGRDHVAHAERMTLVERVGRQDHEGRQSKDHER